MEMKKRPRHEISRDSLLSRPGECGLRRRTESRAGADANRVSFTHPGACATGAARQSQWYLDRKHRFRPYGQARLPVARRHPGGALPVQRDLGIGNYELNTWLGVYLARREARGIG